uniref:Uncharacterized protein n=1 Tax=Gopherus agassizii TaxID=38772 RepID=A0A452I9B6_9SAUR
MSDFVEHAPCENFEANVFAKSRCQNCFRAVGAHHQPSNQVSFLCDLEGKRCRLEPCSQIDPGGVRPYPGGEQSPRVCFSPTVDHSSGYRWLILHVGLVLESMIQALFRL